MVFFLPGLLGAIVGIVCFLILAPVLSDLGVLPYSITTGNEQNASNISGQALNKQVNVKVTSSVTDAVNKVSPAVIAVVNLQKANFFDNKYTETGIGSGIIYKRIGNYAYVVTNNHVVKGASKVEVRFNNNSKVSAQY
ncbi:S1C family serine protease [Terrilactibacillus sp. S3-3]|nr:S1C family serine protease [Terrilactibacillus sp. S3-3]